MVPSYPVWPGNARWNNNGEHGIIQFANGDEPDPESGFCLDDNVRLLVACVGLQRTGIDHGFARSAGTDASPTASRACVAYEWFTGNNLDEIAVNANMGAESMLAYVQAALNLRALCGASEIVA